METELTKKIKMACHGFKPEMPTQMRTIRYAEEVWTPSGIVDVIRFEDYIKGNSSFCALINYEENDKNYRKWLETQSNVELGSCKINGAQFPNESCQGCCVEA